MTSRGVTVRDFNLYAYHDDLDQVVNANVELVRAT